MVILKPYVPLNAVHFISVAILKICEPKLSYMLAELFNMCLKQSCFLGC